MSYYYNYFIGIKDAENRIKPYAPYNIKGQFYSVLEKSRSFASDLHNLFYEVKPDQITDELRKEFEYEDWNGEKRIDVKWLPLNELPRGDYIKRGYFLIDDIRRYEEGESSFDLFYDWLTPDIYARMLQNSQFVNDKNDDEDIHDISEYSYYAYVDHESIEYESYIIREFINTFDPWETGLKLPKGSELVVLETEG